MDNLIKVVDWIVWMVCLTIGAPKRTGKWLEYVEKLEDLRAVRGCRPLYL